MVKRKPLHSVLFLFFPQCISKKKNRPEEEEEEVVLFNSQFVFTCSLWLALLSTRDSLRCLFFNDRNNLVLRVYLIKCNKNKQHVLQWHG